MLLFDELPPSLYAPDLERHEMLTRFLHEKVGLSLEVAEEEACQMEHAISDESFGKWLEYFKAIGL